MKTLELFKEYKQVRDSQAMLMVAAKLTGIADQESWELNIKRAERLEAEITRRLEAEARKEGNNDG